MAENSNIEWCDHTFNPWMGCAKVAAGCQHCYAETLMDTRYGKVQWGPNGTRVKTSKANWAKVRKWNRDALATFGRKARVFCASLADVAEDRPELIPMRAELCDLIRECENLDFLLLTKRPENLTRLFPADVLERCWNGTSVAEQKDADKNIPILLKVPSAVRFVSYEPAIAGVDLTKVGKLGRGSDIDALRGVTTSYGDKPRGPTECAINVRMQRDSPRLDWVIVGGESGPNARPFKWEWAESLRDQCAAAGVPMLFKQTGQLFHDGNYTLRLSGKGNDPAGWPAPMPRDFPETPC